MAGDLASWAHPGTIIGVDARPDNKSHGNHWLGESSTGERWHWIGCNPVHGTYHHKAHWEVSAGDLPEPRVVNSRRHAFFLLWGRPKLRAGDPVPPQDVNKVVNAVSALARLVQVQLDPRDHRRTPVLDVWFRAEFGGVQSWTSARYGDPLNPGRDRSGALDLLRCRLADPVLLARWADPDGVAWGRPAAHLPVPEELRVSENAR